MEKSSHTGGIRGPLKCLCQTVLGWGLFQGLGSTEVFCGWMDSLLHFFQIPKSLRAPLHEPFPSAGEDELPLCEKMGTWSRQRPVTRSQQIVLKREKVHMKY